MILDLRDVRNPPGGRNYLKPVFAVAEHHNGSDPLLPVIRRYYPLRSFDLNDGNKEVTAPRRLLTRLASQARHFMDAPTM
jgi:hypothetical protein